MDHLYQLVRILVLLSAILNHLKTSGIAHTVTSWILPQILSPEILHAFRNLQAEIFGFALKGLNLLERLLLRTIWLQLCMGPEAALRPGNAIV